MRTWKPDRKRFAELLLYVSKSCAHSPKFGATKLNKILFYSDFLAYALLGHPITGFEYQKLENGPTPRGIVDIRDTLERSGHLSVKRVTLPNNREQIRTVALREPDISIFSDGELEVVHQVIEMLKHTDAQKIRDLSHLEVGWKAANPKETIPYGTIFLSDAPLTEEETIRIQQFAREHGYATR